METTLDIKRAYRVALAEKNATKEDLADALDVSYTMSCRYARGEGLTLRSLMASAEFFGMKLSAFIALGETPNVTP